MDKERNEFNFKSRISSSYSSAASSSSYNHFNSSRQNFEYSSNRITPRQREIELMKASFLAGPSKIPRSISINEHDAKPFKPQTQPIPTSNRTRVAPPELPQTSTSLRNTNTTKCNAEPITNDQPPRSFFSRVFSFRSSGRPKIGYALILNHEKFEGKPPRTGTHHDVNNLKTLLNNFDIETHVKNDLTLAQITEKVNKLKKLNFSKYECFIVIILTHGDERQFYAKDDKYEFIELIEDPILKANSTLLDLPKIFITQISCDHYVQTDAVPIPRQSAVIKKNILKCKSIYTDTKIQNGTPFVKSLCDTIKMKGKYEDLYFIFNSMGSGVVTESTMTKPCIIGQMKKTKTK